MPPDNLKAEDPDRHDCAKHQGESCAKVDFLAHMKCPGCASYEWEVDLCRRVEDGKYFLGVRCAGCDKVAIVDDVQKHGAAVYRNNLDA